MQTCLNLDLILKSPLKYDTNEPTMKQKQNQGQREQIGSCQWEKGVGERWIGSLELADASWYLHTHTHAHTHTHTHTHILFHYGLSQDIEYSSLCSTVGPFLKIHSINIFNTIYIIYIY